MESGEKFTLEQKTLASVLLSLFALIVGAAIAERFPLGNLLAIVGFIGLFANIIHYIIASASDDGVSNQERREQLFSDREISRARHTPFNNTGASTNAPNSSLYIPDNNKPLTPRTTYQPPSTEASQEPEVRGHAIYQHALDAIIAANQKVDKSQPLPIDIGLIVYRDIDKPAIYRTHDVPDDADTIQPYVQLHVPLPPLIEAALVKVCFEIVDSSEQTLFSHEQSYTLKDNLNLITPPARLAISELDTSDLWELRLSVGDKLLARHLFAWGEAPTEDVITALEADGEISDEIRSLLEEQAEQPLSLDDLLANDIDQQKQQGS